MTSPSLDNATRKLTDGARNAGRSTVALLRDGGYATIGATDAAVAAVRRLGERAEQLRVELPDLTKLRNRDDVSVSLRALSSNVEERFDALAGRGREVVESLQRSRPTRNAVAQTRAARSQVEAAVTSVRRAGEAGGEAAVQAATVSDNAAVDYQSLTVGQLRDLARERGVRGRHDMNKAQLIAALRETLSSGLVVP
jgi:Rho termination factor, N-terminal domain